MKPLRLFICLSLLVVMTYVLSGCECSQMCGSPCATKKACATETKRVCKTDYVTEDRVVCRTEKVSRPRTVCHDEVTAASYSCPHTPKCTTPCR